ncbi:RNA interference and gene silencing protein [Histoplasma ohiense]|nr:RNA interference and gene silencing protein [Histoplasma ohiense (nom. inval.)]
MERTPISRTTKHIARLLLDQEFHKVSDNIATDFKSTTIRTVSPESLRSLPNIVTYCAEDELIVHVENAGMYTIKIARTGSLQVGALVNYFSSPKTSSIFCGKEQVIHALNILVGYRPREAEGIANVDANKIFFKGGPDAGKMDLTGEVQGVTGILHQCPCSHAAHSPRR